MKFSKVFITIMTLICLFVNELLSQVENIRSVQYKNSYAVIYYDLIDNSNQKYDVKLYLSNRKVSKKILLEGAAVSGEIGKNITPGREKKIIWNLPQQFASDLKKKGFDFIVEATQHKSHKKWRWYVLGVTALGSAAYLILTSTDDEPSQATRDKLAEPPQFP